MGNVSPYRESARRGELFARIVSILTILTVAGIAIFTYTTADRQTVALLAGAFVATGVMFPCGFLVGWIMAARRRQPQRIEGEVIDDVIDGEVREKEHMLTVTTYRPQQYHWPVYRR
jgi:cytochrome bd-type quinol oxidase subunit 1